MSAPPETEPAGLREGRSGPSFGPITWCVLAAVLFGASTPASKPLLEHYNPVLLSGLLYLGAALAVAPWALRDLSIFRQSSRQSLLRLGGAVLFGGIVGPILLLTGLSMANAASVALWLNLETVATALLARIFFKEHLGTRTWIAVSLIVFASIALSGGAIGSVVPGLLVSAACIAWGLDNNLTAVIDQYTPAQITFAKGVGAGTFNSVLGLSVLSSSTFEIGHVGAALGIGALAYGASILFYVAGAQQLGATRSQLIFSTAPAWGIGAAWLVLGEPVYTSQVAAAGIMATAIWLWQREEHAHFHSHQMMTHTHWHRHDDDHHDHDHDGPTPDTWHSHEHTHAPHEHEHAHRPDLHHRHDH